MTTSSGDHGGSAPPASPSAAATLRVAEARVEDIGHADRAAGARPISRASAPGPATS